MSEASWDPDRHIDATAPLLGLTVTPAQRPGVTAFLEVARRMAGLVERALPPDRIELAPVFRPVPPGEAVEPD